MKIQILKKDDREISFIAEGEELTPQFINALRRAAMSEVPTLAIDTVEFSANDSVLYDEMISLRLGSLALTFDPKALNLPAECKCEGKGCSQCQVTLVLDKKGPCIVYAKDLKSSDKEVKPLYPETPIIELFENQRLKLEATAVLGLGTTHAKWQASKPYYRFYPSVKLEGKVENPDEAMKVCPRNALRISGTKADVNLDCDLCQECVKNARPKGVIKVEGDNTKYIFNLESISALSPEEIVLSAVSAVQRKAKDFGKAVEKLE